MGGMTVVRLRNTSTDNIWSQNLILRYDYKIPPEIEFYSPQHVLFEYQGFENGTGHFPEHQFPPDEINSFNDFERFWSTDALGEVFVPHFGTLKFDCYFGRTPVAVMNRIARYIFDNENKIRCIEGSSSAFLEKITLSNKYREAILRLSRW